MIAEDISGDGHFCSDPDYKELGMRASIMVPLISKGQAIGVLSLRSKKAGTYAEQEKTILERLARQIAPAVENAQIHEQVMAEMRAIDELASNITSTLDEADVYSRFGREIRKLVDFDRLAFASVNPEEGTYTIRFVFGRNLEVHRVADVTAIDDLADFGVDGLVRRALANGYPDIQVCDDFTIAPTSPLAQKLIDAGLRSGLMRNLISNGTVIGAVGMDSQRVGAYGPREQAIVERLTNQIIPTLENAHLYDQAKQEMAVADEIARIITSTLDINEVYDQFAQEVKKLVSFDRMAINVVNQRGGTYTLKYLYGVEHPELAVGTTGSLQNSEIQEVAQTGRSIRHADVGSDFKSSLVQLFRELGLHSSLMVPLTSKGKAIGTLVIRDREVGAYQPEHQAILERLANQIAPAVENALIYEQVQAEMAVVDEIASIITSTLDVEEIYQRFAKELRKLVDFDRLAISEVDPRQEHYTLTHVIGQEIRQMRVGDAIPFASLPKEGTLGLFNAAMAGLHESIVIDDYAADPDSPWSRSVTEAGLQSGLLRPLFSNRQVFGSIGLSSRRPSAYGPREQAVLERLTSQIIPALENAHLYDQAKAEMTVADDVARIITGTLDINEVYDQFAQEVNKLVDFDRMAITVVDPEAGTSILKYQSGTELPERPVGSVKYFEGGSVQQAVLTAKTTIREDVYLETGTPTEKQLLEMGLRSSIAVPLSSKGQVIGVMILKSKQAGAYDPQKQAILERLANQIAPAVENAQLYDQAKSEMAVVDEVARIVTSTLDINQVYDQFAEEVKKLVDFDRLSIVVLNGEGDSFTVKHAHGREVSLSQAGDVVPVANTMIEDVVNYGQTLIRRDLADGPMCRIGRKNLELGLRSIMIVPLVGGGTIFGAMGLLSRQIDAYGPRDQAILERLANHIAPAIENAGLYQDLQTSTAEMAVVDEVARIITSTLDIDEVFERFADEVGKLLSFDRLELGIFDPESSTAYAQHAVGQAVPGIEVGSYVKLSDSGFDTLIHEVYSGHRPFLISDDLAAESNGPVTQAYVDAGLRSGIMIPLISNGRVWGDFSLLSQQTSAYGLREQAIMERLAMHIAPAFDNAQLYNQAKAEMAVADEVAQIITSTLDIGEVFEKFAEGLSKLVDFDRMSINTIDRASETLYVNYAVGQVINESKAGYMVPLEVSSSKEVMTSGQTLVLVDLAKEPVSASAQRALVSGLH
ncbi:MAG: GAF domain-containing protein, partial [Dehalococcoidia bacterium]